MAYLSKKPKLLMLITEDWYFWSHRLPIALAAKNAGFDVIIATHLQEHEQRIRDKGLRVIPILLRRRSRNPFNELLSVYDLVRIYREEKPDIVHHVTIKPILYGSWAAQFADNQAVVNAIAGLGYVFIARGPKAFFFRELISLAYRSALRTKHSQVVFQNNEDRDTFVKNGLVKEEQTVLVKGSGVDLNNFAYSPEYSEIPVVMYAGRILWDKGLGELVEASRLLRGQNFDCHVVLVGSPDPDNPKSIPESQIRQWVEEGIISWWGQREDMPETLAQSSIIVLPSYREGLPKILLEAGAIGRPVVATDVTGCRDVIRDGENGFLVPLGDVSALANAIGKLLQDKELRQEMGLRGRKIVEAEFSIDRVISETLSVYQKLIGHNLSVHGSINFQGTIHPLR